jgi:hypothetical protein
VHVILVLCNLLSVHDLEYHAIAPYIQLADIYYVSQFFCVDIILFICWQKGLVDADAHQQLNVPDPLLLPNPFLQLQKFTKKVCVVTHYIMYTSAR